MKISHRLIILSAVGAAAVLGVGGVGLYGVRAVQEQLATLTEHTTPLQNALLELQGSKERAIADLLDLSQAVDAAEADAATTRLRAELDTLKANAARVHALDEGPDVNTVVFENALDDIGAMVTGRLDSVRTFRTAADVARRSLNDVDERVARVASGVAEIAEQAARAAEEAQGNVDRFVVLQQRAHKANALLGDLTVLLYATDALSSRFRIGPLRERFASVLSGLATLRADTGSGAEGSREAALLSALPEPAWLQSAFADETEGLFALRLAELGDLSGAKSRYKQVHKALSGEIERARATLYGLIDELGFDIVLERRAIEAALALAGDPTSVIGVNRQLTVDAKALAVRLERLLLADDVASLEAAHGAAVATLDELTALAGRLASGLEGMQREELRRIAVEVGDALAQTRLSMDAVRAGLRGKLDGESAVSESLASLRAVAGSQREAGARDVATMTRTAAEVSDAVQRQVDTATWLIGTLSVAAVLSSLVLSLIVTRSISARLRQALAVADAVARGHLAPVPADTARDEISQLIAALGRMVATLDGSVRKIRAASARVGAGTEEISEGNRTLSERTEQQAGRLSEAAGVTARVSEGIREGARSTRQASELSKTASEVAGQGHRAVQNAMASMQSIESGAREISSITSVIDAIAFQTNILALNAAVEASRAGESGRGFAVVASEVGSLALKSKESVLQIKEIIEKNVQHVETGSTLVGQAGQHMEEVVVKVNEVAQLIDAVSASGQRQVEEIRQIDSSVGNLEQMTQQNATLSERTTGAAIELLRQSRALDESVSVFDLPAETPAPSLGRAA